MLCLHLKSSNQSHWITFHKLQLSQSGAMSKFYEVSKVLDKPTDTYGCVQFLVHWRGYGEKYDSWVDEENTNECLKQVFRTRHQGKLYECFKTKG